MKITIGELRSVIREVMDNFSMRGCVSTVAPNPVRNFVTVSGHTGENIFDDAEKDEENSETLA